MIILSALCLFAKHQGGDATQGALEMMYDGPRPFYPQGPSWQPMRKQGAIILATGGDNSNSAEVSPNDPYSAKRSTAS